MVGSLLSEASINRFLLSLNLIPYITLGHVEPEILGLYFVCMGSLCSPELVCSPVIRAFYFNYCGFYLCVCV
jgi:hypothetical protein